MDMVLADTRDYLVEFADGWLSIARKADGKCLALSRPGIAAEFRRMAEIDGAEIAVAYYISQCRGGQGWQPLYGARWVTKQATQVRHWGLSCPACASTKLSAEGNERWRRDIREWVLDEANDYFACDDCYGQFHVPRPDK